MLIPSTSTGTSFTLILLKWKLRMVGMPSSPGTRFGVSAVPLLRMLNRRNPSVAPETSRSFIQKIVRRLGRNQRVVDAVLVHVLVVIAFERNKGPRRAQRDEPISGRPVSRSMLMHGPKELI